MLREAVHPPVAVVDVNDAQHRRERERHGEQQDRHADLPHIGCPDHDDELQSSRDQHELGDVGEARVGSVAVERPDEPSGRHQRDRGEHEQRGATASGAAQVQRQQQRERGDQRRVDVAQDQRVRVELSGVHRGAEAKCVPTDDEEDEVHQCGRRRTCAEVADGQHGEHTEQARRDEDPTGLRYDHDQDVRRRQCHRRRDQRVPTVAQPE